MGLAEIIAFLKALPELVSVLKTIGEKIDQGRNVLLEQEVAKQKEKINQLVRRLENAPTKEDLKDIVSRLNSIK
jgi:lipid A disaccharide synthetase